MINHNNLEEIKFVYSHCLKFEDFALKINKIVKEQND